jgi:hypothetical protein
MTVAPRAAASLMFVNLPGSHPDISWRGQGSVGSNMALICHYLACFPPIPSSGDDDAAISN